MTKTASVGHNNPPSLLEELKERHAALLKRVKTAETKAAKADLSPKSLEDCIVLDTISADLKALAGEAKKAQEKEVEVPNEAVRTINSLFLSGGIIGSLTKLQEAINKASAAKKYEIDEANRKKLQAEADALAKKADEDRAKAQAAEQRGDIRMADTHLARADSKENQAAAAMAGAREDVQRSTVIDTGQVRSSVSTKMVCTSVDKTKIDIAVLLPFIKAEALVAAVNSYMAFNNVDSFAGAVVERDFTNRVARK